MGSGRSKLSTILNVLGTILSTYSVPSRWSHSCCSMRACHPEASTLMGLPLRSKPETSTSRCRSTSALYPSTLASGEDKYHQTIQFSKMQCSFYIHSIFIYDILIYEYMKMPVITDNIAERSIPIYLRQPSKKSAVLLLVFLSLGLIITWVQGKTRKNTRPMRKLEMVNGQ